MIFDIDLDDMSKPRSPAELARWVDERCELLGGSPEAKSYARSGEKLPKKFYEEVRPISAYASAAFGKWSDVTVTPNLGNDPYDAIIETVDGTKVYIEVTTSKDGYGESLRLEVLETNGSVNAAGAITVEGRRKSPDRKVTVKNEAVSHDELVGEHLARIALRIEAKADRGYTRDHRLVVTVDDYIAFRDGRDTRVLSGLLASLVQELPLEFSSVAVVGDSGRFLFEISVPEK